MQAQADSMIKSILSAPVYDVAVETPIDDLPFLSARLCNQIRAKREDLQPVFSFKLRGAYTCMTRLARPRREKGVVAASAGNHAQGVAIAAARLELSATIVMPVTTPEIKVRAVRTLGGQYATVQLKGDRFEEACSYALELARQESRTFIHPYDDLDVIAGQGTIGMEIVRQQSVPPDVVFLPVGGGGLAAGVCTYLKYVWPRIRVVAVEAEDSACLKAALDAGRRVRLAHTGIFADGVSVAQIGKHPFEILRGRIDEVVTVNNDEICAAIKDLFEDTRSVAEPAGALSLAGLKKYVQTRRIRDKSLLSIVSGANTNFDRLRFVSERYAIGEHSEVLLSVAIPEKPGSLLELCRCIRGHDITEFNHRYTDEKTTNVFVGVRVKQGARDRRQLVSALRRHGYTVTDLSTNTLAKLHVCHMVGGRGSALNEELYRFEFPERAGVLEEFLEVMRGRWNISLFHYRQHGGCYANVLVGLQTIPDKPAQIDDFLAELGYPYVRETDNPAYALFLGADRKIPRRKPSALS